MANSNSQDKKVVDLSSYRNKKLVEESIARGRVPLCNTHMGDKLSGSPHLKDGKAEDSLAERIIRIKASLEKINTLMAELKKNMKEKPVEKTRD